MLNVYKQLPTNGLTVFELKSLMRASAHLDKSLHSCIKAMFSVAFFAFLRPCELATAPSSPQHQLRRGSVKFTNKAITITFSSFKHSTGKPAVVRVERRVGCYECPWTNLWDYLESTSLKENDLLFPHAVTFVQRTLDRCAKIAKQGTRITLHSFRRGGATWASHQGWSVLRVQAHGRWKSDGYKSYIKST